jgi:hypothetical protein
MDAIQTVNVTVGSIPNVASNDPLIDFFSKIILPLLSLIAGFIIAFISFKLTVREQEKNNKSMSKTYLRRIKIELTFNLKRIDALYEPLNQGGGVMVDKWLWISSISGSFIYDSYQSLMSSGYQRYVPSSLEDDIHRSYTALRDISSESIQYCREIKVKQHYMIEAPNKPASYDEKDRNEIKAKADTTKVIITQTIDKISSEIGN